MPCWPQDSPDVSEGPVRLGEVLNNLAEIDGMVEILEIIECDAGHREAEERAARTVNKTRREHGETKSQRSRKKS